MPDGTPEGTLMGTGTPDQVTQTPDQNAQNQNTPPADQPAWMAQLPDDLKTNEVLAGHATIGDVSKGFLDLQGKLEGTVRVPGENATAEEKAAFYTALGRPENAADYEFGKDNIPEGIEYDEQAAESFKAFAHELGLSQPQASAIHDLYNKMFSDGIMEYEGVIQKQREEATAELTSEWGDKFDGNIEIAKRALKQFGGDEFTQFVDQSGLGNNPMFVKMFHKIGAAISEDGLVHGEPTGGGEERERTLSGKPMLSFPSMEQDD